MPKPPKSPPHSDIDGVHQDERPNVDTAIDSGQDNSDIKRAAEKSVGRPAPSHVGGEEDPESD